MRKHVCDAYHVMNYQQMWLIHLVKNFHIHILFSNIDPSNGCSLKPEPHTSGITFFKRNDSVTIKCSFQYSAYESCNVTPIWTDLTGYRDLTIPGDDFEVSMDDKHAWIHFRPGADMRIETYLNLSIAFSCSSLPHNNHIQYEFGQIPFTIYKSKLYCCY